MESIISIFEEVPDPRDINAQHDLSEMLFIAVAASLCGADSCSAFAEFGRAKEPLLRQVLVLEHGIPSHDTFSRVFRVLDPGALEVALRRFVDTIGRALGHPEDLAAGHVVAVDGKRLRGAYERGRASTTPILVSAYLNHTRMALAQTIAPGGGEVKGVLALLELIDLRGATVTGDALHCTAKTARAVRDKGADYLLALKGNRSTLAEDAEAAFGAAGRGAPFAETADGGHDRLEHRVACVVPAPGAAERHRFAGLSAFGRIEAWRQLHGKAETHRVHTFALSRVMTPEELLATAREHWSIENGLHWPLDVVFNEDRCRTRKDHGPANLAVLRKIALNLLRANPAKTSLRLKRLRAGWDDAYLIELMTHVR